MMTFNLHTHHKKILTDTITPVTVYYKIRDKYPNSILLESGDYHKSQKNFSYICFNPIASIKVENEIITQTFPDGSTTATKIDSSINLANEIHNFTQRFKVDTDENFKFINNGLFGFTAYDAVRYFEDIEISKKENSVNISDVFYAVYKNIIAINHFKNEAYIDSSINLANEIHNFTQRFKVDTDENFKFINNGLFGFTAYDAVRYFEDIEISKKENSVNISDVFYAVYKNIIAINHFKNEAY